MKTAPALLVALVALALGAIDLFNFDLGLARKTGEWIVEHRAVPQTNVFSAVHADRPFLDDKWLFHVLAWLAVDGVGPTFTVLLRMAFLVALGWLMLPRREDVDGAGARWLAAWIAIVGLVAANERFGFRPELLSMVFLALFARVLIRDALPTRREVALLLVTQCVWANSHGYFVIGPIVAAAAAAGALLDAVWARSAWRDDAWKRAALVVGLIAVCFVNPYGWRLVWSPVEILLDLQRNHDFYSAAIVEFVPTFGYQPVPPSDLIAYKVLLGVGVIALLVANRRVRLVELLPLLVLFWMSLDIRRNVAGFAVVAAPLTAGWLSFGLEAFLRRRAVTWSAAAAAIATGGLVIFLQLTQRLPVHDRLERTVGFGESSTHHPDAAVDFVLAELPADGMFNSFSFGSYFVGRAFPERRPFIDGNTAGYDVSFFVRYADLVNGRADVDAAIEEYGLRYFVIKPGHPLTSMLLERADAVPLFLGRHGCVIGLRGRLPDDLLDRHDLRRRLPSGRVTDAGTPRSTRWRRQLPTAELNHGRLLRALGRVDLALRAFGEAAAVNDELYEPYLEQGIALLESGRPDLAVRALDEALARADTVAEAWSLRGLAHLQRRRLDDAAADLEHAAARNPGDAVTWTRRGMVALESGDLDAAIEWAGRAIDLDADLARAHAVRGRALVKAGREDDAEPSLRRALELGVSAAERDAVEGLLESLN